jgi:hypothetical protein
VGSEGHGLIWKGFRHLSGVMIAVLVVLVAWFVTGDGSRRGWWNNFELRIIGDRNVKLRPHHVDRSTWWTTRRYTRKRALRSFSSSPPTVSGPGIQVRRRVRRCSLKMNFLPRSRMSWTTVCLGIERRNPREALPSEFDGRKEGQIGNESAISIDNERVEREAQQRDD